VLVVSLSGLLLMGESSLSFAADLDLLIILAGLPAGNQ